MIYLKSVLAGVVALLCTVGVLFFAFIGFSFVIIRKYAHDSSTGLYEGSVAWDPVSLQHPLLWIVLLAAFIGGYVWRYRKLMRCNRRDDALVKS